VILGAEVCILQTSNDERIDWIGDILHPLAQLLDELDQPWRLAQYHDARDQEHKEQKPRLKTSEVVNTRADSSGVGYIASYLKPRLPRSTNVAPLPNRPIA
jgi:hypothetical protein